MAELFVVLCICAEQTFMQASAQAQKFSEAFSIALDAYVKSTVRDDVMQAIAVLFDGEKSLSPFESPSPSEGLQGPTWKVQTKSESILCQKVRSQSWSELSLSKGLDLEILWSELLRIPRP
ncbi:hypothetical protein BDQ12DRAFT_668487 [Crucibulum laeve]|uniref:Uncharacterized protein n=1 Tax=Crucibulum laeve TaxID=68775 RepID=A0A5C3LTC3_9AGAR|nr:hypothetical protein BDQ12DRAFT_668487 [Crucibulum laeve]